MRYHTLIAAIFFDILILIVLTHYLLAIVYWAWKKITPDYFQKLAKNDFRFKTVYPGRTDKQIADLLRETWTRVLIYEDYLAFREKEYNGSYVNVSPNGYRRVLNQGPWPPDDKAFNIFFFGGSTAFGSGVLDGESIPSFLQNRLRTSYKDDLSVYNFGRSWYFSTQERILLEQLLLAHHVPDLVIFFDGMNDFFCCDGKPAEMRSVKSYFNDELTAGRILMEIRGIRSSPLTKLYRTVERKATTGKPEKNSKIADYQDPFILNGVIGRFVENKKIIEALAKTYGFSTAFIIQPSPFFKCNSSCHLFPPAEKSPHRYQAHGYPLFEQKIKAGELGENILWLGNLQEGCTEPLYVDGFHYTAAFSETIAVEIERFLAARHCFR